jgi:hypothetical protein
MKFNFRKISAVVTSALLAGMTMGVAAAANYPVPFVQNGVADVAVVYGANSAVLDQTQATLLMGDLNEDVTQTNGVSLVGGSTLTESEIVLGGAISSTDYEIRANVTSGTSKGKVPTLFDDKISWDDGTGSSNYRFEEKLLVGGAELETTFDDDRAEGIYLTNDMVLEYQLVFKDDLNVSAVGTEDADTLYLSILGKEYEVESMETDSITVVTSDEYVVSSGDSVTVNGKTFTVTDVFSESVFVNGQSIAEDGKKKIDGMRVEVDSIGYSETPGLSRVILRIGEDLSKTYTTGEEYIGEDEDDPQWTWNLNSLNATNGYIGVKYNHRERLPTNDVVYEGESYLFPENFAEVKFVGTNDVSYEDFKVYFVDKVNLWNSTETTSNYTVEDAPVLVIEGPTDTSIQLTEGDETNKVYLRWANGTEGTELELDHINGSLEVFQRDVSQSVQPAIRDRYVTQVNSTTDGSATIPDTSIGKLINGETELTIYVSVTDGAPIVKLMDNKVGQNLTITVGGNLLNETQGTLEWLGGTDESTNQGVAEATDVILDGENLGTKEVDILGYSGVIVNDPKANAESDEVAISVPNDQLYGEVSVTVGGEATTSDPDQLGAIKIMDSEVGAYSDKNLIVVGGSCINSAAASLVGGAYCGSSFTQATGVGSGQYLIKGYATSDITSKLALLVAGYEAADTQAAVTHLRTQTVDTSAEVVGQTA